MEAYESWSEGSTDEEGYVSSNSSLEPETSEKSTSDTESEAESEGDSASSSSGGESDLVGAESASGQDTLPVLSRSAFPSLGRSQDEEELWGMEVDAVNLLCCSPLRCQLNTNRVIRVFVPLTVHVV